MPANQALTIGDLIRQVRKQSKLTQAELASKLGIGRAYIGRLENGKADLPMSLVEKLAQVCKRSVSLTFIEGDPFSDSEHALIGLIRIGDYAKAMIVFAALITKIDIPTKE